jgi:hypothetical protein
VRGKLCIGEKAFFFRFSNLNEEKGIWPFSFLNPKWKNGKKLRKKRKKNGKNGKKGKKGRKKRKKTEKTEFGRFSFLVSFKPNRKKQNSAVFRFTVLPAKLEKPITMNATTFALTFSNCRSNCRSPFNLECRHLRSRRLTSHADLIFSANQRSPT